MMAPRGEEMKNWRAFCLVGASALCILATARRSQAAEASSDPCGVLSDAEVVAVLGQPLKSKKPTDPAPGLGCAWRGQSSNLYVRVETPESRKAYKAAHPDPIPMDETPSAALRHYRKMVGPNAVAVTGVGEEAFWDKAHHQFWFIKKERAVLVTLDRHNVYGWGDDLEATKAAALKVAGKI
jgi:hypothetical protein